jgi:Protein of unknown function (DUF5672)
MLKLPDVTLVMVETREHELARLAIKDCTDKVEFGDVLILTNDFDAFGTIGRWQPRRRHLVPDWPDKLGWSRSWWFDVPPLLQTRYTLNIQWDSWVWDASMWSDEFLMYDYIGAPWWYKDGKNVGNGGFSIVSSRLKRYVLDRRGKYPCDTSIDDDLLCRKYRRDLELAGFVWAPERVAHQFAFECCRPSPTSKHFGFHAMFNWPEVLPAKECIERIAIACSSPYIRGSYMMKAFRERHPAILKKALRVLAENRPDLVAQYSRPAQVSN